jgi:hypothetical protein
MNARHLFPAVTWLTLTAAVVQGDPPVRVHIQEEKTKIEEIALPVEPTIRAQPNFTGNMSYGLSVEGKRLTFGPGSARTNLKIDGQLQAPNGINTQLPKAANGKARVGMQCVSKHGNLVITQTLEVVAGKPSAKPKPGEKRRMDTLLVRYTIENKDAKPHTVGVRLRMDTYCWTNDGCLFASPEKFPGKILDGVELKGKDVPNYLQILQNPDLNNPGWVAHFTLRFGSKYDGPTRAVLTWHGANDDGWNTPAMKANGDSEAAFYWDDMVVPAGGKRELAFAHGQGIAASPESEGRVALEFAGNFEPGKVFTITAVVSDPVEGQSLHLALPPGLEVVEGKDVQPVSPPSADGIGFVMWKARVVKMGTHTLKVRSSNGVEYTTKVTIEEAPKETSSVLIQPLVEAATTAVLLPR